MYAERTALTYENMELIRLWTEDGWGERRIAKRLGISCRSVGRARDEMGIDVTPAEPYVDEVAVQRAIAGDRAVTLIPAETRLAVLALTEQGRSRNWIAHQLGVSTKTVDRHRAKIRKATAA